MCYIHTFSFYHASLNLIPVKLLSGSKEPFWAILLLPYLWKFDSRSAKAPFWESNFLCVYNCLVPYLLKFDSRKAAFWLKRAVLGIKFPMCYIHTFSFYHASLNLIPGKLLSGSKSFFLAQKRRFGNQKGRFKYVLHSYILLLPCLFKFDSRKASFWLKRAVLEIKSYVYTFFLPYLWKFDSRVYILPLPYLLKFDSRKAACWLKRAVLGIKFPMCIQFPSTMPLEI